MVGTLRRIVDDGRRTSWWRCDSCGAAHRPTAAVLGIPVSECPAVPEGIFVIAPSSRRPTVDWDLLSGGAGGGDCTRRPRR